MTTTLRALLAALALLAVASAQADEVAEAKTRFEKGAALFHAGKYREAIGAFQEAYRLKPHGAIHFNVAQCREKLGEWPAALHSYHDYLRELPEARDRAAVRAAIVRIEQKLVAAGVQALLVYTDPPGAAVRLDGKPRGRTPFHITLAPGAYRVTLALDGFAPEEQEVEVTAGASRVVEVVLRSQGKPATAAKAAATPAPPLTPTAPLPATTALAPSPASTPTSTPTPTPTPTSIPTSTSTSTSGLASGVPVGAAPARSMPDLTPPPPAASPLTGSTPPPAGPPPRTWGTRRILAWTISAAAVAAASMGAVYGSQARDASSQLRDGTRRSSGEADALARDAKDKAKKANLFYGVGGAAAAAGVTLFVLEGRF